MRFAVVLRTDEDVLGGGVAQGDLGLVYAVDAGVAAGGVAARGDADAGEDAHHAEVVEFLGGEVDVDEGGGVVEEEWRETAGLWVEDMCKKPEGLGQKPESARNRGLNLS